MIRIKVCSANHYFSIFHIFAKISVFWFKGHTYIRDQVCKVFGEGVGRRSDSPLQYDWSNFLHFAQNTENLEFSKIGRKLVFWSNFSPLDLHCSRWDVYIRWWGYLTTISSSSFSSSSTCSPLPSLVIS